VNSLILNGKYTGPYKDISKNIYNNAPIMYAEKDEYLPVIPYRPKDKDPKSNWGDYRCTNPNYYYYIKWENGAFYIAEKQSTTAPESRDWTKKKDSPYSPLIIIEAVGGGGAGGMGGSYFNGISSGGGGGSGAYVDMVVDMSKTKYIRIKPGKGGARVGKLSGENPDGKIGTNGGNTTIYFSTPNISLSV
jgi:hypothetical protein